MTDAQWRSLVFFSPDELKDGEPSFPEPDKMSLELMKKLDRARKLAQTSFVITSSYREGDKRTHGRGEAVDIRCASSGKRDKIVRALIAVGFVRKGIYDKHLHADVGKKEDGFAQNVLWWGKSKVRSK